MESIAFDTVEQRYKYSSVVSGPSYFLIDVLNTLAATRGLAAAMSQMQSPTKIAFTELKAHILSAIRRYVSVKYNLSFSMSGHNSWGNYSCMVNEWSMSPYLSDVYDGATSTSHLVIGQFRCHGHALGSAVQKLYFRQATPHCLCCGAATQETVWHVLVQCTSLFATPTYGGSTCSE